jgi:hypothetical protein
MTLQQPFEKLHVLDRPRRDAAAGLRSVRARACTLPACAPACVCVCVCACRPSCFETSSTSLPQGQRRFGFSHAHTHARASGHTPSHERRGRLVRHLAVGNEPIYQVWNDKHNDTEPRSTRHSRSSLENCGEGTRVHARLRDPHLQRARPLRKLLCLGPALYRPRHVVRRVRDDEPS